jgi:hypothetical protein
MIDANKTIDEKVDTKKEETSKSITISLNPQSMLTVFIAILLLFSSIQTIQLISLKRAVGDGSMFQQAQAASVMPASALPDMVGGC